MDLAVLGADGSVGTLFEVKVGGDRQSLYAAIGQLYVHGLGHAARRVAVLPAEPGLKSWVVPTLKQLGIEVVRWREVPGDIVFSGLDSAVLALV